MNKDTLKAITDFATARPKDVLKMMLDSGVGVEIIERKFEDCDSLGTLYFKVGEKYFGIPFYNYSFGECDYRFGDIREVQPKTKPVMYFE